MALRRPVRSLITLLALASSLGMGLVTAPVKAQESLLETGGTIVPAESIHTFEGQAGQVVTITLESEDFDPVLSLQNSIGEEIAFNDDFGGSLNSRIVAELPADGTYRVVARSYSGNGGDFDLVVRFATEYEVALAEAEALTNAERYTEAIAAYTTAIALAPDQSIGYLGRAQATLGQVYLEQGPAIEGPEDIPAAARQSVVADFEQAADLIEAEGDVEWANSLREQAAFLQGVGGGN
ncbi:MAG: PPC domain-containing protein [Spirulina sp.]